MPRRRHPHAPARADKAEGESDVLATIAAMPEPDRALAERLHAIINASAPALSRRLWYGMPAYAKDSKVVCFFRDTQKFKERYMTLGFNQEANLDESTLWPIAFALKELTADEEARIAALVRRRSRALSGTLAAAFCSARDPLEEVPRAVLPDSKFVMEIWTASLAFPRSTRASARGRARWL